MDRNRIRNGEGSEVMEEGVVGGNGGSSAPPKLTHRKKRNRRSRYYTRRNSITEVHILVVFEFVILIFTPTMGDFQGLMIEPDGKHSIILLMLKVHLKTTLTSSNTTRICSTVMEFLRLSSGFIIRSAQLYHITVTSSVLDK
ncbi:hypothetical protein EVAR_24061_1 [Eumeta japonica]|uniref:Transmembrane protein n=1 Tax=Eumeta variegata TaxID=151549 RepID=A0A4C1VSN9_EUMVA|nr:hypothetical protein EVAR_24061_1 [Eumeta japonica]